jgi:NTP pyrophosphatase (non-canonical NTP hydrolase)
LLKEFEAFTERERVAGEGELTYDIIAMQGEAGEISSAWKKYTRKRISLEEFKEELLLECGDTFHYMTRLLHDLGFTIEDMINANVEKLQNRKLYGKGNHGTRS